MSDHIVKVLLLVFILSIPVISLCQRSNDLMLNYYFSVGISGQTDVLDKRSKPFGTNGIISNMYGNGGNDEGFGIPLKLKAYSSKFKFGLIYEPILRYDVIQPPPFFPSNPGSQPVDYGFFADHHFSIYHNFAFPKFLFLGIFPKKLQLKRGNRNYFGVGYSMMSSGLSYSYEWDMYNIKTGKNESGSSVDISFNGVHVFLGLPLYKNLFVEATFLYVPEGQRMFDDYLEEHLGILKLYYQFKIK